ncbi:hypothetical protein JB92DRAFT_2834954 [Gautieria morchelliformis]|nr:hypothetical protein JB92DRAFT_2834954 [Gautieria morchelliformis]
MLDRALPGAENRKKRLDSKLGAGGVHTLNGSTHYSRVAAFDSSLPRTPQHPPRHSTSTHHARHLQPLDCVFLPATLAAPVPKANPCPKVGSKFVDRDSTQLDATTSL